MKYYKTQWGRVIACKDSDEADEKWVEVNKDGSPLVNEKPKVKKSYKKEEK